MSVDPGHRHHQKQARSGEPLDLGTSTLKWYEVAAPAASIAANLTDSARAFVAGEVQDEGLTLDGDHGFVILHRCGDSFYFLLVSVWRGSNELWEAVYYRDEAKSSFARFDPAYPDTTMLRPTFCVWELGVIVHEAEAWSRFLQSSRGEDDLAAWRNARYDGAV